MRTAELDTKPAPNAFWATMDARMRNEAGRSHWTEQQQIRAQRLLMGLTCVWASSAQHINYRQKWITVKLCDPQVRDRRALALLEADLSREGIDKRITAQGVIYRIHRA